MYEHFGVQLSSKKGVMKPNYYELFQEKLTEARYGNVVDQVITKAEGGDLRAARLIMEHAQGKPMQRIEVTLPQHEALAQLQRLLADKGQPVEWSVIDEGETRHHDSTPPDSTVNERNGLDIPA